jgi:hypothetical protein
VAPLRAAAVLSTALGRTPIAGYDKKAFQAASLGATKYFRNKRARFRRDGVNKQKSPLPRQTKSVAIGSRCDLVNGCDD